MIKNSIRFINITNMQYHEVSLRKLQSSSAVVRSSVAEGLYGLVASNQSPEWSKILSHYVAIGKQAKALWQVGILIFHLLNK